MNTGDESDQKVIKFVTVHFLNQLYVIVPENYVYTQLVVGLIVLSLEAYVVSKVHGFQTSFELFGREGHFP
jgi:hypothetical protein